MKQILPVLFLLCCLFLFPKIIYATISLSISSMEKKDDYYIVNVKATGLASTSGCFIQGMFTATPSSYFGYTWSPKGEWLKYDSSPDQEYVKANFVELKNDEPQNILVKPDAENSSYKGPGDYLFKVWRFIANGNSSNHYSNIVQIALTEPTPTQTQSPTEVPTTSLTNTPTSTPTTTPTPVKTLAPTVLKTPSPSLSPSQKITSTKLSLASASGTISGEILGESTDSASFNDAIARNVSDEAIQESMPRNTTVFKYTFVFGAILTAISGGWLYFRHHSD